MLDRFRLESFLMGSCSACAGLKRLGCLLMALGGTLPVACAGVPFLLELALACAVRSTVTLPALALVLALLAPDNDAGGLIFGIEMLLRIGLVTRSVVVDVVDVDIMWRDGFLM